MRWDGANQPVRDAYTTQYYACDTGSLVQARWKNGAFYITFGIIVTPYVSLILL